MRPPASLPMQNTPLSSSTHQEGSPVSECTRSPCQHAAVSTYKTKGRVKIPTGLKLVQAWLSCVQEGVWRLSGHKYTDGGFHHAGLLQEPGERDR